MGGHRIAGRERCGDLPRQAGLQTPCFVGRHELLELAGGIGLDARPFRVDHPVVHFPLRPLLGVPARTGSEAAGDDDGRTREHERPGRGAGGREPFRNTCRRDDSVVEIHD